MIVHPRHLVSKKHITLFITLLGTLFFALCLKKKIASISACNLFWIRSKLISSIEYLLSLKEFIYDLKACKMWIFFYIDSEAYTLLLSAPVINIWKCKKKIGGIQCIHFIKYWRWRNVCVCVHTYGWLHVCVSMFTFASVIIYFQFHLSCFFPFIYLILSLTSILSPLIS